MLKSRKNPRSNVIQVATEMIENINDNIYDFRSNTVITSNTDGLLNQIAEAKKNRFEENVVVGLRELITACV